MLVDHQTTDNSHQIGLCWAAADWSGEANWRLKLPGVMLLEQITRHECVSNSRLSNSHHTESEAGELDTNSLDSSSFDYLLLPAPHTYSTDRVMGTEESLSSSPFESLSISLTVSFYINESSNSRSRSSPSSTEQIFHL